MAAKVWNDSRFTLSCTQLNQMIHGHHFITVSDEAASRVPQNGIFRVEYDEKPAKRAKKDPNAHLEDGANPNAGSDTTWFAGDPKAKSNG